MPNDMRKWARLGAEARMGELQREMQAIVAKFPELRGTSGEAPVTKRRSTMSAAARKAISDAQKKRWAAKRQADGAKAPAVGAKKK